MSDPYNIRLDEKPLDEQLKQEYSGAKVFAWDANDCCWEFVNKET